MHSGYAGDDEVRLRAEIYVPTSLIGRLVGKGGQNVREDGCILILILKINVF
jgi:hypothetical protein